MTPPEQESVEARVAELAQLCANPSDHVSAGLWCQAANEALQIIYATQEKLAAAERERAVFQVDAGERNAQRARAEAAERERDELGNKLAQERAKPGGSFDQWAALQDAEERVRVAESCIGFCEQWASHPDMQEARAQIQERIARYRVALGEQP